MTDARSKKKAEQEQAKKIQEMLGRPENAVCCDCNARGPRWCSVNIGAFLCKNLVAFDSACVGVQCCIAPERYHPHFYKTTKPNNNLLGIRCAGLHRKLGTHVSKIKSASLDTWTPEQLKMCSGWGNERVNAKYYARGNVPTPNSGSDA